MNTGLDTYGVPQTPRGGFKLGGIGKVGGEAGLLEMVESKLIDVNRSGRARPFWFPAGPGIVDFLTGSLMTLHGGSLRERLNGALALLRNFPRS
ncbi:hypothetical protein D3C72_1718660 [compost metagenome]